MQFAPQSNPMQFLTPQQSQFLNQMNFAQQFGNMYNPNQFPSTPNIFNSQATLPTETTQDTNPVSNERIRGKTKKGNQTKA